MTVYAVGIDPSLTGTGVCFPALQGPDQLKTVRGGSEDQRLVSLHQAVAFILALFDPRDVLVAVEDLPTNAMGAGKTGMAHGVVRLVLAEAKVPYGLVAPATLKKFATNNGNASKADMRMAMFRRAGIDCRDDNQVDAWWLAQAAAQVSGESKLELPKGQREALVKAKWPETVAARMLRSYETLVTG